MAAGSNVKAFETLEEKKCPIIREQASERKTILQSKHSRKTLASEESQESWTFASRRERERQTPGAHMSSSPSSSFASFLVEDEALARAQKRKAILGGVGRGDKGLRTRKKAPSSLPHLKNTTLCVFLFRLLKTLTTF